MQTHDRNVAIWELGFVTCARKSIFLTNYWIFNLIVLHAAVKIVKYLNFSEWNKRCLCNMAGDDFLKGVAL